MKIKKLACMAGLLISLAIAVPAYSSPLWSFEDDDVEAILRDTTPGGAWETQTSGVLTVGDVFWSVFEMPVFAIDGVPSIPPGSELTGVAAVQLVAIIPSGALGGVGTQYIFAPWTGFNAQLDAYGYTGADLGAGAMVAMFLNSTSGAGGDINLNVNRTTSPGTNCGTVANCSFQASLGSLFQVDGFRQDPDEFWVATQVAPGGNDIGAVLALDNGTLVASFNFALSNLFNAGGPVGFQVVAPGSPSGQECFAVAYVEDNCAQFVGSGTVSGGQGLAGTGFIAHSDFDADKYIVPEPATLSLLGLGLLGLGVLKLRKKA